VQLKPREICRTVKEGSLIYCILFAVILFFFFLIKTQIHENVLKCMRMYLPYLVLIN